MTNEAVMYGGGDEWDVLLVLAAFVLFKLMIGA